MMNLEAAIERIDAATTIVTLTGRMTLGMSLREIESKINHVAEDGTQKLVLDLAGVEYADSAGLGLLMLLHGKMKMRGGQLRLAAPDKHMRDLFKTTCTDTILAIDPDRASALAG